MNIFLSILYYFCIVAFAIAYIVCFILNLVREIKITKQMKKECKEVEAKVTEIIREKKRVYVKVEYISPTNHIKFIDYFEFTVKEFNDQYYVDQDIKIYYPNIDGLKRITYFPVFLDKSKIKVKISNLFTDGLLSFVGIFMTIWLTSLVVALKGFNIFNNYNTSPDNLLNCNTSSPLIYLLVIFMFVTTIPYIIERLVSAPREENQNYLKLYGAKSMAEVKTFKFSRNKDANGNKESLLEIEFYDNKGELVKARLNSFMYTQTQEQIINILYDLKNPKNVVYMRK